MPTPVQNPFDLSSVGGGLSLGDQLFGQVKEETEEERKRRLMQQKLASGNPALSPSLGVTGPISGMMRGR